MIVVAGRSDFNISISGHSLARARSRVSRIGRSVAIGIDGGLPSIDDPLPNTGGIAEEKHHKENPGETAGC